jgi:MFS family permease
MVGATGTGRFITRTGRWKGIMLAGAGLLVVGLCLMGLIDHLTPLWHLSVYMLLMGLGTGALMQNLVLVVQNTVDVTDVGAAGGVVSFFRSLGGTIGVAVLGAVLATRVADRIATGLADAGLPSAGDAGGPGTLDLDNLPPAVAAVVRTAYADATGRIFLIAGLVAIATFVAVWLMPVTELRTTVRKVEEPALEDVGR